GLRVFLRRPHGARSSASRWSPFRECVVGESPFLPQDAARRLPLRSMPAPDGQGKWPPDELERLCACYQRDAWSKSIHNPVGRVWVVEITSFRKRSFTPTWNESASVNWFHAGTG